MKEWYNVDGLKMNSNITVTNFNKRTETFQMTINGKVKHMDYEAKNPGVILDSRLSFEHHIKSLYSRLNGTQSYRNSAENTFDLKSRIFLINALIFCHLNQL